MKYDLQATAAKTAKKNNLLRDGKRLYDLSLLDRAGLDDRELNAVLKSAERNVWPASLFDYCSIIEEFYTFYAKTEYSLTRALSADGKIKYDIYRLEYIQYASGERDSIYEDFDMTEQKKGGGCLDMQISI